MKFSLTGTRGMERALAQGVNATWSAIPKSTQRAIKYGCMHHDSKHIEFALEHVRAVHTYYEYLGWTYTPPKWAEPMIPSVKQSRGGPLKISSTKSKWEEGTYEITFKGTEEEIKKVEAALTSGSQWVRGANGKHEFVDAHLPAPPPIKDPLTCEQWPPTDGCKVLREEGEKRKTPKQKFSAEYRNIYIWHISGYGGHPSYETRIKTLESWGFECLRSRRGTDGKIWECWFLGGMMLAKGDLKGTPMNDVASKIFRRVNPGVLEFAGERWCLTID